jgi:limonene-1,2-epoxide hydrolase
VTDSVWTIELFRSIDAKDTRRFVAFLTEDAQFRFGNAPPAIGASAITAMLDGFFASIKGLRHEVRKTWTVPDHVLCEGTVTYTRLDGTTLSVPFVDIFAMQGRLIKDYLIYLDASQLYK